MYPSIESFGKRLADQKLKAPPQNFVAGGDWHLTGGFWGLTQKELADLLINDRFERR